MEPKITFRCQFTIDWPLDKLNIGGLRSVFNNDNEVTDRVRMNINTSISYFIEVCTFCIASEQGENKDVDLTSVGIRYGRETFDDRYFYCGDLQISVGEVYIMYEILKRRLEVRKIKMFKFTDVYYLFLSKEGYIFLSDKSLSNVGMFRYSELIKLNFTLDDNIVKDKVGFNKVVQVGLIQSAWLERGACHPYVNLKYRDMILNMSLAEFNKLKSIVISEYSDFDFTI